MNKSKKIFIIGIIIFLAIVAIVTILLVNRGHRLIRVESFEGVVAFMRGSEEAELINGMNLKSEDKITTGEDGLVDLLIDEDKHILAREDTCFTIVSNGNEKKGKLLIELEYGSSLIEIENKLEDGASVEVSTPNAALSVRGTTFDVEYNKDDNTTMVAVADGVVNVATDVESTEVFAGWVAIVKNDKIEVQELPIAYRNYTHFAVRYWSSLEYSDIYVKELVGLNYKKVEQSSRQNEGFVSADISTDYWLMTKSEIKETIDYYGYPMVECVNADGYKVLCGTYDGGATKGYYYCKELDSDLYLTIYVYLMSNELVEAADIETYLPLTNDCYYVYVSGAEDETVENEASDDAITVGQDIAPLPQVGLISPLTITQADFESNYMEEKIELTSENSDEYFEVIEKDGTFYFVLKPGYTPYDGGIEVVIDNGESASVSLGGSRYLFYAVDTDSADGWIESWEATGTIAKYALPDDMWCQVGDKYIFVLEMNDGSNYTIYR